MKMFVAIYDRGILDLIRWECLFYIFLINSGCIPAEVKTIKDI